MLERIKKHIEERNQINELLKEIMPYADDTPFEITLEHKWKVNGGELFIYDTEDEYAYNISSWANRGDQLFMGEKDGITYVMAYAADGKWYETTILILDNKNKI